MSNDGKLCLGCGKFIDVEELEELESFDDTDVDYCFGCNDEGVPAKLEPSTGTEQE